MQDSRIPIENVSIELNNGVYTTTNHDGKFTIKAKVGDKLVIRHQEFETINYTIKSNERISIEVATDNRRNQTIEDFE